MRSGRVVPTRLNLGTRANTPNALGGNDIEIGHLELGYRPYLRLVRNTREARVL